MAFSVLVAPLLAATAPATPILPAAQVPAKATEGEAAAAPVATLQAAATAPAPTDAAPADAVPVAGDAVEPAPALPGESDAPTAGAEPAAGTPAPAASEQGVSEIVVTGRLPSPADPVEHLNAVSYAAVQAVDTAFVGPITHAYTIAVPKPVRDGMHNVLNNLDEPIVFLNFLLQLKPGKAAETLGRFVINSTLGVGGLFDVAKTKTFKLPRRSNGLADTLGYYGVGPGPYLFLPVIGATTLRDLVARPFDLMVLPGIAKPFADPKVSLAKGVLSSLDERQENDAKIKAIHAAADPYVVQREEYLARRRAEIEVLKGKRKSIDDPPYYVFPGSEPKPAAAAPDMTPTPIAPLPAASAEPSPAAEAAVPEQAAPIAAPEGETP